MPPLAALPSLDKQTVKQVLTVNIVPSPFQPRKEFPADEMEDLATSVRDNGIQIPLLGRPAPGAAVPEEVELVAGERRVRTAKAWKLESVPMIVRKLTDDEVIRIQRLENAGRENLKALEAAEDYVLLQGQGKTVEEICALHGVKRSHVFTRIRVAKLPTEIKQLIKDGKLSITIADLVAKLPTVEMQKEAAKELAAGRKEWDDAVRDYVQVPLAFRAAQERIAEKFQNDLTKAPFDLKKIYYGDVKRKGSTLMLGSRGSCAECPHRTGNCKDLYPDQKNPNICTEPDCFIGKVKADTEEKLASAKARGLEILSPETSKKLYPSYSDGSHPVYGSGYATLDQECDDDDKERSFATLLKGHPLPKGYAVLNNKGVAQTVYKLSDIEAALVKAGHKFAQAKTQRSSSHSAIEVKRKAERLLREQVIKAVLPQIRAKAEKLAATPVGQMKLLRWLFTVLDEQFYNTTTTERIDKQPLPAAWGLGALIMCEEESENTYGGYPDAISNLAELIGIDLKAEEKKVNEATKELMQHNWQKTDLVSGANTNYQCTKCKLKAVRHGLEWPPRTNVKDKLCTVASQPGDKPTKPTESAKATKPAKAVKKGGRK